MAGLTDLSLADLARALRKREASAVEVVDAHLARIAALDGRVHAFVAVEADAARAAARAADTARARGTAGALAGLPVAVKDIFAVVGLVRGNGSRAFADDPPMGLLLFKGETPQAAEAFARADPYVQNGVVLSWRVREWVTVVGPMALTKV